MTLNVEKDGADRELRDDLEKWRPRALGDLQARFPLLKGDQEGSRLLGQILSNMHWQANGSRVQTQVQISGSTWKKLGEAVTRISKTYVEKRQQR